jgi:hypothetical protein
MSDVKLTTEQAHLLMGAIAALATRTDKCECLGEAYAAIRRAAGKPSNSPAYKQGTQAVEAALAEARAGLLDEPGPFVRGRSGRLIDLSQADC